MTNRGRIRRGGTSGTAAIEFGMVASVFVLFVIGLLEFGRMIWVSQALQVVGQQTARCVAIGSSACAAPASYAVSQATTRGVVGLTTSNVAIATVSASTTPAPTCLPPNSNTMVQVKITMPFSSGAASLLPGISQNLVTISCFPVSGT